MEFREWAIRILSASTLEEKLLPLENGTDNHPGPPLIWQEPNRPPGMEFCRHNREDKLPPFHEHHDVDKRAICLHRFAGHELLAVEIMAFTLLAFPYAPAIFRKGIVHTLQEEQGHVRLYMQQMNRLGIKFGDMPLYRHFWRHTPYITSPLHYVSVMNLTFEMANLDFAPMYAKSFAHAGDTDSALLMQTILKDEIMHVRFGWHWLKQFKPTHYSSWQAWQETLATTLLTPKRAKGFYLHEEPRRQAQIPNEWITALKQL